MRCVLSGWGGGQEGDSGDNQKLDGEFGSSIPHRQVYKQGISFFFFLSFSFLLICQVLY